MSTGLGSFGLYFPEGHEKALTQAFYNIAATLIAIAFCAASVAVYYILQSFLRPLLWAILCGSFLHPFKNLLSEYTHSWLSSLLREGTPLAIGVTIIPIRIIDIVSTNLYHQLYIHAKLIFAIFIGLPCIYTLYYFGPIYKIFIILQECFFICHDIMGHLSGFWIGTVFLVYIINVYFWWTTDSGLILKLISFPVWFLVLLYFAGIAGSLRVPILLIIFVLMLIGYLTNQNDTVDRRCSKNVECDSEKARLSSISESTEDASHNILDEEKKMVHEKDTKGSDCESKNSKEKKLSDLCFMGLAWAFGLVMIWKNLWIMQLIPFMLLFVALKKIGSHLNFWTLIEVKSKELYETMKATFQNDPRTDVIVIKPVRGLIYLVSVGDRKVVTVIFKSVDKFMSIAIILLLLFAVVFSVVFSFVQIHKESMYMVTFTSNLFNSSLHPEISEWLPDNLELENTFDGWVDDAYIFGREWISSKIQSMLNGDEQENEDMKRKVLHVWDQLYHSYFGKNSSNLGNKSASLERQTSLLDSDSFYELINNTEFSLNIVAFLQENVGTLMAVLESVWLVLKGNLTLCFNILTAVLSILLGGSTALLNFLLSFVIFITTLFYLLASSGKQYKPLEWFSTLSPHQGGSKLGTAVEEAISSVFSASIKMSLFYGFYTWLTHIAMDINIVFIPSALAAIFAAIPFVGTYWAAIPGAIELWLIHGQYISALVLLVLHFLPTYFVDTAIYSDIKGGHPYVTGLAITGGMFWLGLEGAIIGPIILCCVVVAMNVCTTMIQLRSNTTGNFPDFKRAHSSSL